jgi:hypothetical protein
MYKAAPLSSCSRSLPLPYDENHDEYVPGVARRNSIYKKMRSCGQIQITSHWVSNRRINGVQFQASEAAPLAASHNLPSSLCSLASFRQGRLLGQ